MKEEKVEYRIEYDYNVDDLNQCMYKKWVGVSMLTTYIDIYMNYCIQCLD